jgi:hypothetical protein
MGDGKLFRIKQVLFVTTIYRIHKQYYLQELLKYQTQVASIGNER